MTEAKKEKEQKTMFIDRVEAEALKALAQQQGVSITSLMMSRLTDETHRLMLKQSIPYVRACKMIIQGKNLRG